jgi:tetratricopeptide (TPR) repeat protein
MAKNYKVALKIDERNNIASEAEEAGDVNKAIRFYEQNIREDHADKFAFERLMIIYRKQKEYKDELRVIKRGIEVFQQSFKERVKHSLARRVSDKKLEQLSNAILKISGQKKEELHFPDPIDKWLKRKKIVEKKLKSDR